MAGFRHSRYDGSYVLGYRPAPAKPIWREARNIHPIQLYRLAQNTGKLLDSRDMIRSLLTWAYGISLNTLEATHHPT